MKVRKVIEILHKQRWYEVKSKGGHRQFKHKNLTGRVTVPGKPNDELKRGTLNSIFKQACLK